MAEKPQCNTTASDDRKFADRESALAREVVQSVKDVVAKAVDAFQEKS